MLRSPDWLERKATVGLLRRWDKLKEEQRLKDGDDELVAVREEAQVGAR